MENWIQNQAEGGWIPSGGLDTIVLQYVTKFNITVVGRLINKLIWGRQWDYIWHFFILIYFSADNQIIMAEKVMNSPVRSLAILFKTIKCLQMHIKISTLGHLLLEDSCWKKNENYWLWTLIAIILMYDVIKKTKSKDLILILELDHTN